MLSSAEYIRQSLGLHLFFLRIMKEHSFFLQAAFLPRDSSLAQRADEFRVQFEFLLAEAVSLSNGVVSPSILRSGEVVTPYTLNAEMATQFYSGVNFQTGITQAESGLSGDSMRPDPVLEQQVNMFNNKVIMSVSALIQFKTLILSSVLSCTMFTVNYPLLIDHILREAKLYLEMMQKLQNRMEIETDVLAQEMFWNRIMAEHSKFIRGLLDPTENALIETADKFGNEFDALTAEARAAMESTVPVDRVTGSSLKATQRLRDFKAQGTQGLLECKIKSIIIPLLGDHVLREANHYLRLLKMYARHNV